MIAMAIDPGLARVGYGVVEKVKNAELPYKILEYGCIRTKSGELKTKRIKTVYSALKKIARRFRPTVLILERLYFAKNAKTAMLVGESCGAILLLAAELNLPVEEFTPLQVKQAVSGFGRASKHQIKEMVKILYKLPKAPTSDDAADALAIAATYFQTQSYGFQK